MHTSIPDNLIERYSQDPLYSGNPWKTLVLDKVYRREEFIHRGDSHSIDIWGEVKRAPTADRPYVRVKQGMNEAHNLCVVSRKEAGVMMIHAGQQPEFSRASKRNPASIFDYFRWYPVFTNIQSNSQPTKPLFLTDERLEEFEERKKRLEGRKELSNKTKKVKYICTCGRKHVKLIDFDSPQEPPEYCPDGGRMGLYRKNQEGRGV